MPGDTRRRYPPELKERAVRMVVEVRPDHESDWAAMMKVAQLLGVTAPETISIRDGLVVVADEFHLVDAAARLDRPGRR